MSSPGSPFPWRLYFNNFESTWWERVTNMSVSFSEALSKQFFIWSGWVFTVGGAIGSFVLGQAYAWIGWLTVAVGLLALTSHAFVLHRRLRELEAANLKLTEQATRAEAHSNAVPITVIEQLVRIVSGGVSSEFIEELARNVSRIERLRKFFLPDGKPLNPRTFTVEAGRLYAVVKVASPEQAACLIEGDLFSLFRKGSLGIEVKCARLRVLQPPANGTVMFEVFDADGGEMTALRQLAQMRDVAGITGYFVEPAFDLEQYPEFSADIVNEVIARVVSDLDNGSGGQP